MTLVEEVRMARATRTSTARVLNGQSAAILCFLFVLVPLLYACGLCFLRGVLWHQPWPADSFLPSPPLFGDFRGGQIAWMTTHFYGVGVQHLYPPASDIPLQILGWIAPNVSDSEVIAAAIFLVPAMLAIGLILKERGALIASLGIGLFILSYPTLFAFWTGNLEGWVGAILLWFAAAKLRNRLTVAAVLLGVAISMKGVPAVFLPVLLVGVTRRAGFRAIVVSVGTAVGATVLALLVLPGGLTAGLLDRMKVSQSDYAALMYRTEAGTHFGHSFLNGIHAFFGEGVLPTESSWKPVLGVGLVLLGAVYANSIRRQMPLWMMLGLSATAGCLLVPVSTDYKLLYFIPAIMAMLAEEDFDRRWLPGAALMCFIVTPKPWGLRPGGDVFANASAYLTPALMIALVGWVAWESHSARRISATAATSRSRSSSSGVSALP